MDNLETLVSETLFAKEKDVVKHYISSRFIYASAYLLNISCKVLNLMYKQPTAKLWFKPSGFGGINIPASATSKSS